MTIQTKPRVPHKVKCIKFICTIRMAYVFTVFACDKPIMFKQFLRAAIAYFFQFSAGTHQEIEKGIMSDTSDLAGEGHQR